MRSVSAPARMSVALGGALVPGGRPERDLAAGGPTTVPFSLSGPQDATMPETGDADRDHAERLADDADVLKNAWQRTLEDMEAMAEEREAGGWDVVTVAAGHTAPEPPDAGDFDRFGLVYVVPDNEGEEFAAAFREGGFPKYEVYRQEVQGRVFLVTELLDPETERAILVAGGYELRHAGPLVSTAREEDEMYTHVQTLDQTVLGSFRHDDWEKFFPHADRIENWTRR